MHVKSSVLGVFLVGACALVSSAYAGRKVSANADHSRVQQGVERVLQQVDSSDLARDVATDEFIINAFKLINNRQPHLYEFYSLKRTLTEYRMKRSDLLAVLLAGTENRISWEKCRLLLRSNLVDGLRNTAGIQQFVQSLKSASPQDIIKSYQQDNKTRHSQTIGSPPDSVAVAASITAEEPSSLMSADSTLPDETYNAYFGYLHAHTSYSDGDSTPAEAYRYARNIGQLDFFAVTDHGELLSTWPWNNEWEKIKAAANASYAPGSFVTLWGFEYSNPFTGHINIINTDDFTSAVLRVGIGDLYNWLNVRPAGFGIFNHPGEYDFLAAEFLHFDVTDRLVIPQLVGIETWNGAGSFDQYYYQNVWWFSDSSYLDTGNRKGWFLGALGAQDNHDENWGTSSDHRTGVLAKNLTREEIVNAYRARRFYATEDKDLHLDFRCSGYPMGSRVAGVSRSFTVTATDASGDSFSEVRLYKNGVLIAVNSVAGSSIATAFTDYATRDKAYYYVIIKQDDDNDFNGRNDEAISSSIWIQ